MTPQRRVSAMTSEQKADLLLRMGWKNLYDRWWIDTFDPLQNTMTLNQACDYARRRDSAMKVKRIHCCLWCGTRSAKAQSAFCYRDAGVKLINSRHRTHVFQWNKWIEGWYGKSIKEMIDNDLTNG